MESCVGGCVWSRVLEAIDLSGNSGYMARRLLAQQLNLDQRNVKVYDFNKRMCLKC